VRGSFSRDELNVVQTLDSGMEWREFAAGSALFCLSGRRRAIRSVIRVERSAVNGTA
jgi:hypothetical protein